MRDPIYISPARPNREAVERVVRALTNWEPRDIACDRCDRELGVAVRHAPNPCPLALQRTKLVSLDDREFCRHCARPITPEAEAKAPISGFVKMAQEGLGDRVMGHRHWLDAGPTAE